MVINHGILGIPYFSEPSLWKSWARDTKYPETMVFHRGFAHLWDHWMGMFYTMDGINTT